MGKRKGWNGQGLGVQSGSGSGQSDGQCFKQRGRAGLTEELTDKQRFQGDGYPGKKRFRAEAQRSNRAICNEEASGGSEGQEVGMKSASRGSAPPECPLRGLFRVLAVARGWVASGGGEWGAVSRGLDVI